MQRNAPATLLTLLSLLVVFSVACGQQAGSPGDAGDPTGGSGAPGYPLTVTDATGREVTLQRRPDRIVSMAPSATETLFAVGAGERVVGVTTSDDYPPEAEAIEAVGDSRGPNFEKVLAVDADLMVLSFETTRDYAENLEDKTKTTVLVLDPKTVDQAISSVGLVGEVVGNEQKGRAVERRLRAELARIGDRVAGGPRPTVFYEVWGDPLQTAGPGSFIDDAIRHAGGANVAADAKGPYPQYSEETLLRRNPDYYLVGESNGVSPRQIADRPGYEALSSVREDNIALVNDDLIVRPGPRIVSGVREIAEEIHPDEFE